MAAQPILLGVIGRPHGVRGLVRIASYTADAADLVAYGPLFDVTGRWFALRWKGEGVAEIAELVNGKAVPLADRNAAERLTNTALYIERDRLPHPDNDEFYLADLVGLTARDTSGATLGEVAAVHDYGAGVSLEIARGDLAPLLVPFTRLCVPEVELEAGRLTVAPPEEVVRREVVPLEEGRREESRRESAG